MVFAYANHETSLVFLFGSVFFSSLFSSLLFTSSAPLSAVRRVSPSSFLFRSLARLPDSPPSSIERPAVDLDSRFKGSLSGDAVADPTVVKPCLIARPSVGPVAVRLDDPTRRAVDGNRVPLSSARE